ncbi:hypothetical protein BABINDRAFT_35848 [Babjeviella inositovora NRRL Y-12698]|uniref:Amino acid permease/ SLC12A domain-containing protein n=1 Tax=Babjeviella inositovora NRRL Y-12698 TaxID=984486 RepID=A0A1E3QRC5_9ASCO|nr:uncharacterized protein BABINDRAFT_35848 [Babjeviella inositovora NRRL Y-12698]ODQ80245.1 hypothetical protein BABINDRAFT_35848 [Babjeviella inositovora NRRL Y-12698]
MDTQPLATGASDEEPKDIPQGRETKVERSLKARQVSMIALGGTIGTGLFIGSATPLAVAGPVNALIAYIFIASIAYSVTQSLGEMATYIPITGSFATFTTRFVSQSFGAMNGWMYWFSWAITFAIEISVVGQVIQYWTKSVPLAAWIGIFFTILTVANLFPVKFYGEVEFWVAAIKIVAIVGWLVYAFCMVCGAGKTGPVGFRYWRNPGPWGPALSPDESGNVMANKNLGRFLGFLSSLINASFTYQGTELVGVTAGETKNPRVAVPKAIRKVFYRIMIFFVLTILFMGLLVPYDDPKLASKDSYISSSPFVIAIQNSGTPVLPSIFNAVILCTIISAGNSNVYIASRTLYALADSKVAPKFFMWTRGGVPIISVLFSAAFGLLGFLVVSKSGNTVFEWLVNISAVAGMIAWIFIGVCHIRFQKVLALRGISRDSLPFKAPFQPYLAWYSTIAMVIIIFIQGYGSFFGFNASNFFTAYISLILAVVLWIAFQIWFRCPLLLSLDQIDIDTGRREADNIIWEDDVPKNLWEKFWDIVA